MSERVTEIAVSIVDDDESFATTVGALIDGDPGMRTVSRYSNGSQAVIHLPNDRPSVVIMDLQMPKMSGIEAITIIKPLLPETQFLVLTSHSDDEQVFDSLAAGATGYLLKRSTPAEILQSIGDIHAGGSPMSSYIARKVVQSFTKNNTAKTKKKPPLSALSPREDKIVSLLAQGHLYKEIATTLGISLDTVRTHIRRVYEKLQVNSRTEAVVKYLAR